MRVTCPHCGTRFQVRAEAAGKRGRCPNEECKQIITVPLTEAIPNPGPARPAQKRPTTAAKPRRSPPPEVIVPQVHHVRPVKPAVRKKKSKSKNSDGISLSAIIGGCALLLVVAAGIMLSRPSSVTSELHAAVEPAAPAATAPSYADDLLPFMKAYCADCHANGSQEGDFAYDRYAGLAALKNDRMIWTKVLKLIKVGAMPPPDSAQPSAEERDRAIAWLDHQLFYVDCNADQNPGRVTVKRLNRTEYNNTVNDLLGINFRPADDFPSDDVGHGFDNIGDVLTVPPLLMEKYLAAAEMISEKVIPTGSPVYARRHVTGDKLKPDGKAAIPSGDHLTFVSGAQATHEFDVPRKGKYKLKISARQDKAGPDDAKMEVKLAGKTIKTISVEKAKGYDLFTLDLEVPAGKQKFAIAFTNDFYDEKAKNGKDRNLHVEFIELEGPMEVTNVERQKFLLTRVVPGMNKTPAEAAKENLETFLPKAFRRAVTSDEINRYAGLTQTMVDRGESFDQAMRVTLQAILISPHFLFRVEGGRRIEGQTEMLDDYALASRLSYFLWSSMPDDELFQLAKENKLHEREVLRKQTERLLNSPRSSVMTANFAGQWLGLRKLTTNEVDPDAKLYPEFTKEIRLDLWKETETFFDSVVRNNSSIYDLLDGKYTFLNERLAKFYGVAGVTGPEFRRVDFKDEPRAGVLTQGSVLTLTSYPDRTSPVKRGEWVLANLLGDAPPEAPPQVPALDQTSKSNPNLTFRQQLELHRADPGCASCHKEMDAIGFGMQTFDAVGRFRTKEGPHPVDASGMLPSGETFNGPLELISILRKQKSRFGRCLTEKMLTYALGRGVEWYDRCTVDQIMTRLEQDDRMSTLIFGIVESAPFQSRTYRGVPSGGAGQSVASTP